MLVMFLWHATYYSAFTLQQRLSNPWAELAPIMDGRDFALEQFHNSEHCAQKQALPFDQ